MTATPGLKPASESPWYVLMTVAGAQTGFLIDDDLGCRITRRRAYPAVPVFPSCLLWVCRPSGLNVGLPPDGRPD